MRLHGFVRVELVWVSLLLLASSISPLRARGRAGALARPAAASGQGAFESRFDYSELRGLPPRPATSTIRTSELSALFGPRYGELRALIESRHAATSQLRIIESYARDSPVYLSENLVYAPNADGVIQVSPGLIDKASINPSRCDAISGTHSCEKIYDPTQKQQAYEVVLIVGWDVELSGPVQTDGQSLIIVAQRFRANGFAIDSSPIGFKEPEPPAESTGPRAASGRNGRSAGNVAIYAAELDGVHVVANGQAGEPGRNGKQAEGQITKTEVVNNHTMSPSIRCTADVVRAAQAGGNGGAGGNAGQVLLRYALLRGTGPGRPSASAAFAQVSERSCAGACDSNSACLFGPALAICGVSRESDNTRCADRVDNDGDGLVDCKDPKCVQNPFVTVCGDHWNIREATPEACTDGVDNDHDGRLDCADPDCQRRRICGAAAGQAFVVTTGAEEATTAACSDGVDNDADGSIDCADVECRKNPLVSVCGGERTLEACTDKRDNDGDGQVDCADTGCSFNPYVIVCNAADFPFMKESTAATCSDHIDNDADHFRDCDDFQCRNNPLASSVCGNFENSLAACSDGADNDGDGAADCADSNCVQNPFFGELLCKHETKTKHRPNAAAEALYNGAYRESDASFSLLGAGGSIAGTNGEPLKSSAFAHMFDKECFPCSDEECRFCTDTNVQLSCLEGVAPGPFPSAGSAGKSGTSSTRSVPRPEVDSLRALLSPRQWVVGLAQANTLFKRDTSADREQASFTYLLEELRMLAVLDHWGVSCPADGATLATDPLSAPQSMLRATICPVASSAMLRLAYLAQQRTFFGEVPQPALDPHRRYDVQRDSFMALSQLLGKAVSDWVSLANGLDVSFQIGESQKQFEQLSQTLAGELQIAEKRESAAQLALSGIADKLTQRKLALAQNKAAIETNNQTIQEKYKPANGGLGKLALDLAGSFAAAYGMGALAELGKGEWKNLVAAVGKHGATLPKPGPKPAPGQPAGATSLDDVWKFLQKQAGKALGSKAVQNAAKPATSGLADFVLGKEIKNPVRSVVVDEIANELRASDQRKLVLDQLDLELDRKQAEANLQIAQLEHELAGSRLSLAAASADRIAHYAKNTAELRAYDKVVLGQEVYGNALSLVEDLNERYFHLLRQAEYEKLPFATDGQNQLNVLADGALDFNLKNHANLERRVIELNEALQNRPRGGASAFYRRVQGDPLVVASEADLARLAAIGLLAVPPFDRGQKVFVAPIVVNHADLDADPVLRSRRNVRIDDIRVNVIGSAGVERPAVFLVRDGLDAFRVGRQQTVNLYREFDLSTRGSGAADGAPIHYQSLSACRDAAGCTLGDPACVTTFQQRALSDFTCGLHGKTPGPVPWKENLFYDRSLVGRWLVAMPEDVRTKLGEVSALELSFSVAAQDL